MNLHGVKCRMQDADVDTDAGVDIDAGVYIGADVDTDANVYANADHKIIITCNICTTKMHILSSISTIFAGG